MTALSPWRSFGAFATDWGLIALCFAAAMSFPSPVTYAIAMLLIARTQLALAVLMHEGAHGLLSRRRAINDFAGQVFAAAPLMVSLPTYRRAHLKHHRDPMVSEDPVAVVFEITDYPISRRRLASRLVMDLTGVSILVKLYKLMRGDYRRLLEGGRKDSRSRLLVPTSILAMHGVMLGVLSLLGRPGLYVVLWLLPLFTLFQVMGRIRAIMEHAGYPPGDDQTRNARTIVRPTWQTFFFGPHAVHFHIEHHEHVRVPFYRLPEVHEVMAAEGRLPASNLYFGYGAILREVTSRG